MTASFLYPVYTSPSFSHSHLLLVNSESNNRIMPEVPPPPLPPCFGSILSYQKHLWEMHPLMRNQNILKLYKIMRWSEHTAFSVIFLQFQYRHVHPVWTWKSTGKNTSDWITPHQPPSLHSIFFSSDPDTMLGIFHVISTKFATHYRRNMWKQPSFLIQLLSYDPSLHGQPSRNTAAREPMAIVVFPV